ncbi:response regulator transcription factor [Laspinema sp. D1]|uniref:Response regulator transcription factor n=1 Tax=Laspinema palackyanum D2a TaxID=2953684 RepID=A0ABT2ML91_9CYAN|nr:response regulator transcription factor [Laspinema sp. D2b]MCT7965502.1 response regulator transcription factor [Laspinema sp. D2a]
MKVLLVEDEPDLGAAIKRTLEREAYVVDWAKDGTEGYEYIESYRLQPVETPYTLAIFDWLLPALSGIELCKRLRASGSALPVLMLTAKDSMEDKVAGLDAGADDYLVKPFGMAELLARLRALQRRSPQLQPQQIQVGNLTLDYGTRTLYCHQETGESVAISMTNKEFQLLEYLMRHPQQIITRDRILDRLWELGSEPGSNVVAAQMRLLRRKLAEQGYDRLIETVYGLGYRFKTEE